MEDVVIIGAGPAGLTASIYAVRAGLKVRIFEKAIPGGQAINTDWIENYPGFPDGISGFELMDRMRRQAELLGISIENEEVKEVQTEGNIKKIKTSRKEIETKTIIICSGSTPKRLGIKGEESLIGKGVSFCATCDAPFFRGQEVAVIGGGDSAVQEAIYLTKFAKKVYLIHRRDKLRATKLLQERAFKQEKINFIWDTIPTKIIGKDSVEAIELKNLKNGNLTYLSVKGVFVFIGLSPNTAFLNKHIQTDESGFIITDAEMHTSASGVFAAGDVRSKLLRQISTAVGDGAIAAFSAARYIEDME